MCFNVVVMYRSICCFKQIYSIVRHNQINVILYFICSFDLYVWIQREQMICQVPCDSQYLQSLSNIDMFIRLLASSGAGRGVSFKPLVRTVYIKHFKHTLLI